MIEEHKLEEIENKKSYSQKLEELIVAFRSIKDFENDFYNKLKVYEVYDLINKFIFLSNQILKENKFLLKENYRIQKDSKSLRKFLSKIAKFLK